MRWRRLSLAVFAAVFGSAAHAQNIPAGDQPGQIEHRFQQTPEARARARQSRGLEATMAPSEAAHITLILDGLTIIGSTVFSADDLAPFYQHQLGRKISLTEVFQIAARITAHYGQAGYSLSRAIVPAQELEPTGATVRLEIIEGYIDQVIWPAETQHYRDTFSTYSQQITSERPIRAQTMERYLLLANDLPGLTVRSTLRASKTEVGASTMVVSLDHKRLDASLSFDNRGTRGSGPVQGYVTAAANNILGQHERFEMSYITAGPSDTNTSRPELHFFRVGFSKVLNGEGLTFEASGNASLGDPDTPLLNQLELETESLNGSVGLMVPFIRTRPENLTGRLAFEFKNSTAKQLDQRTSEDKLRIVRAELAYDKADEWRGVTQIIASVSHGLEGLGSTKNSNPIASRANGKVDFRKTTALLARTQQLTNKHSLYVGLFGQVTNDPLLSSQECGLGGSSFGRGFDPSIITGDRCLLGIAELRYDASLYHLGLTHYLNQLQFYAFADAGRIWNLDAPLGTPSQDDGASGGLGFRFSNTWLAGDVQATQLLNKPTSIDPRKDQRLFFRLSASY